MATRPRQRIRLRMQPQLPYSLERTTARFARFPEAVDRVETGSYARLLLVDGKPARIRVEQNGPAARAVLRVTLEGPGARLPPARTTALAFVERALGATTDLRPFYRAFRDDPLLGPPIRRFRGLRVAGRASVWEALVTAILAQQVNLPFAYSIRAELARSFGRRAQLDGETWHAFPGPEAIARLEPQSLRPFRLSRAKAAALVHGARAFCAGELSEAELAVLPDAEVIERLVALKGIGRWTAETVLMRGLGRPDAFPAGDLGVVKALAQGLLGREQPASEAMMRRWAERWRPWRALALTYAYAELAYRRAGAAPPSGVKPASPEPPRHAPRSERAATAAGPRSRG